MQLRSWLPGMCLKCPSHSIPASLPCWAARGLGERESRAAQHHEAVPVLLQRCGEVPGGHKQLWAELLQTQGNRELGYSGNVFALLSANLLPLTIFMWHSPALNAVCSPTGSPLPFAVVSPPTFTLRYFFNFTVLPDNGTDTS